MPELIDRANVLVKIYEFQIKFNETGDSHERVAYASAEHCMLVIKAAPVVEAEPVRHGQWIEETEPDENGNVITMCNQCYHTDEHCKNMKIPYCWYCGAKMLTDFPEPPEKE